MGHKAIWTFACKVQAMSIALDSSSWQLSHQLNPLVIDGTMQQATLYRSSSVLWGVWGVVHIFFGVFLLYLLQAGQVGEAFHGIAGQAELSTFMLEYPNGVAAVMKQHGYNLLWFGLVTLIASVWVWRRNVQAAALCALVGGLADLGYFMFIDLGGLAVFPGPQMTWIAAAAIGLSGYAVLRGRSSAEGEQTA